MKEIPASHPRYESLITREKISRAMKDGIVHETGLIAHGRGEAFDYLIGEKTNEIADSAERVASAALLYGKNPVISLNGNVVALAAKECIDLANSIPAKIEINLFHRTQIRIEKIAKVLLNKGAKNVYGKKATARISDLDHDRNICDKEGIYSADIVLVPLEDGDRCYALKKMNKKIITIDLNPLSRTARTADITIVDNVTRAITNMQRWINELRNYEKNELNEIFENWDNEKNLKKMIHFISKRLNSLFE
jgi:4-phosphopantoate--beta-alanine ligase